MLPADVKKGAEVLKVPATGELTLHGVTKTVDIPAQELRGSGVPAMEPAEYTGGFEAGANQAEGVWAARRPYSPLHQRLCEFFHKAELG